MIWATLGGVTIGLAVLIWHGVEWYPDGGLKALRKGKKGLDTQKVIALAMDLVPFALAWCYGALGILTTAGFIAWAFDSALWAANWLGDVALWFGVGQSAGVTSHGDYLPLTDTGACAVFLLTVVFLAFRRKERYSTALNRGVVAGFCLGTSSGVAGMAAVPLAQAVNWLGETVYGAVA